MERSGKCLCGAVSYTAKDLTTEVGACHCTMCRRWTGGPLLATRTMDIAWNGSEHIKTYTSSAWAERGFCQQCGTCLFYRITAPGKYLGATHLAFGTLDDQDGFSLTPELFIDQKPSAYTFEGERKRLTAAEVQALFGGG